MCGFHMYLKFFMEFLQILQVQLSGVHCLILCLKIFRLSEFFILFGKFRDRTAPIVLIVSKPNLFVLIFLLVFNLKALYAIFYPCPSITYTF